LHQPVLELDEAWMHTVIRRSLAAATIGTACLLAALGLLGAPAPAAAIDPIESGRFVWHDLMSKDVNAAKRFYGALFGWRFEDTKRGDRPYVLAQLGSEPVAGIVDISSLPNAGAQWLSYMAIADVDKTVAQVRSDGGQILVEPRELPSVARVAVIADPQGAPLGLAQLRRNVADPTQPRPSRFFWQEYLAKDAAKGLEFYKRVAGYDSRISDTQLGIEYHVLAKTRARAGLFQLPATTEVLPNWLPYVLVDDPAALAARVSGLGGRILVPAAPDRRKGSLVVIADPEGAPIALQKYPF
jgi:predicted enzyme related to lactoylglutathione lyase